MVARKPHAGARSGARHVAWEALRARGPALRRVDELAERAGLEPRERAFVRRLVGTAVRRRGTLLALEHAFARGRPNPDLAAHVRLGLAQIFLFEDVADHAAVSETVRAAADTLGLSKGRYVNAVLRAALRARQDGASGDPRRDVARPDGVATVHLDRPVFRSPTEHPLLWIEDALSVPATLAKRWTRRHGMETTRRLAYTFLEEPDLSLRVTDPGSRASLRRELAELGVEAREGRHAAMLVAPSGATQTVVHAGAFLEGRLTVQGETALAAAELVGAREGERVLELCAAPGGKTAVLAGSGARVASLDRDLERLRRVPDGLRRLGLAARAWPLASDAAAALCEAARFDACLIDAPCSNTGVLGARPEARWRYGPRSQASLIELQARLFTAGARHVRPGGRLVWSTCSLEPEENGRRVRAFLEAHGGWQLEEEREALPEPPGTAGPVDGGYAARLVAPR